MKEAYADLELEINDAKTKIMLIGKQNPNIKSVMQKRLVDYIQIVKEFRYLGLIINNLSRAHKDVQKKRQKAEAITKTLCKWRNGALGILSCLGLWQIFIRSQIRYAAAIYVTSEQTEACKNGLDQLGRSSIRKMLGLWKSANNGCRKKFVFFF